MELVFELVALIGTALALVLLIRNSVRQGRIQPALYMTIAYFSTFWLEPAYDWGLYAVFGSRFVRLPTWGYLGATPNGLPVVAGPAYAVYFLAGSATAVAAANVLNRRLGVPRPFALLIAGYAFGLLADLIVESVGTRTHMWEFTRAAPWFVLFGGTPEQIPLAMPVGMGIAFMLATYLLGMVGGRFLPAEWSRRFAGRRHGTLSTLLISIGAFNAVMAVALVPYLVNRAAGWITVASRPTDAVDSHAMPIAAAVYVVWFAAMAGAATIAAATQNSAGAGTGVQPEEPTPVAGQPVKTDT
jgi:hypothetical protein